MPKVSISEAARLAGVSRQHLYKRFITPGVLSVEKDGKKPPMIETSELLRVFGELKGNGQQSAPAGDAVLLADMEMLRKALADKDAQLQEAKERESWLRQHVSEITGTFRLLEDKSEEPQSELTKARELKEQYKAALLKSRARNQEYMEALAAEREALSAERNKGFWARLLGG